MESAQPKRKRRGGRAAPPTSAKPADAFTLDQSQSFLPTFSSISDTAITTIIDRASELLVDHGVVVIHEAGAAALKKAGATDGRDPNRLKIPAELLRQALDATPKSVTLYGKTPNRDMALPRNDGSFIMRTGTGAHGFVDPQTSAYRNLALGDVEIIAKVANNLDEVGFIAHPFVHGVPELTSDIHSFGSLVAKTDKHCWIQPYNWENVDYLMRIAAVAAGGETALRERPIASCIVCSFSPMEFKVMDVEAIIQAGRYGLPIHACSLPSAGGTAPVTTPGHVLMAVVEIMAMVVLAHVLAPGTPVIATPLMFTLSMRTGSALQSCVESLQAASMAIQVVKRGLGLVAHTYGSGSDTPDVDVQSMAERALICQTIALSGADILGGVGQLECATVFSPIQAILDNEIGAQMRRFKRMSVVDEETLNWREIPNVKPGGHFLDSMHTLKYCREQLQPVVMQRADRDDYENSGRRTAFDEARDTCLALMEGPLPESVPGEDAVNEIADIVAAADKHILAEAAKEGARAQI